MVPCWIVVLMLIFMSNIPAGGFRVTFFRLLPLGRVLRRKNDKEWSEFHCCGVIVILHDETPDDRRQRHHSLQQHRPGRRQASDCFVAAGDDRCHISANSVARRRHRWHRRMWVLYTFCVLDRDRFGIDINPCLVSYTSRGWNLVLEARAKMN